MFITFMATVTTIPGAMALLPQPQPFQLGLVVEVLGLGLLCGVCAFFGAWFGRATAIRRSEPPTAAPVAPTIVPAAPAAPEAASGVTPDAQITAVIAAALAETLEPPYRILGIQPAGQTAGPATGMTNPWAMEGRFQHFSSHKIR
jgi:hypothetical protein